MEFATLAASVPARSAARVCSCAADADEHAGFVFIAGVDGPHPEPDVWRGAPARGLTVLPCPSVFFWATLRGVPTANTEGLDRIGGWRRKGLNVTRL